MNIILKIESICNCAYLCQTLFNCKKIKQENRGLFFSALKTLKDTLCVSCEINKIKNMGNYKILN